jgi:hypothetical protein
VVEGSSRKFAAVLMYFLDHWYSKEIIKLKVRNQSFAPTLKAPSHNQQFYQLVAEKCFPSHKMAEEQIFMIFLTTTA